VSARMGRRLSGVLVVLPVVMHVTAMRGRLSLSFGGGSWDDVLDGVMVVCGPVVLHGWLCASGRLWWWDEVPPVGRVAVVKRVLRTLAPVCSILFLFCFQERVMIPCCRAIGVTFSVSAVTDSRSAVATSFWMSLCTVSIALSYGIKSFWEDKARRFFGDYEEDVFQLFISAAGFFFALAIGVPLSLCPMVILVVLSFTLYMTSKMLRYMVVLITTISLALTALLTYRLSFLNITLPNTNVSLLHFSILVVLTIFLLGVTFGILYRSGGGIGSPRLSQVSAGGLLVFYAFLMSAIEITLVNEPDMVVEGVRRQMYPDGMPTITGGLLLLVTIYWTWKGMLSSGSSCVVCALTLAKLITVSSNYLVFKRYLVSTVLFICLAAPYCFFQPPPTISKTKPQHRHRIILAYNFLILPISIIVSATTILQPLLQYFNGSTTASTAVGLSGGCLTLWGFFGTAATGYLTRSPSHPHSTDDMTKLTVLGLILGLVMSCVSPAHLVADTGGGGWGFLLATVACLLAMMGPLELKERCERGKRDDRFLFRLMLFSLSFSGGASWFVSAVMMRGNNLVAILMIALGCMMSSFFGTVATVLGYYLPLEEFIEVISIAKLWLAFLPVCTFIAGITRLVGLVPSGGWFMTFGLVCGSSFIGFAVAVKQRKEREKNSVTRGIANFFCVLAFLCMVGVTYAHYGLASVGVKAGQILGIPMSIFLTIASSLILVLLEGEPSNKSKRSQRLSSKSPPSTILCINLHSLSTHNRFVPSLTGTSIIFIIASVHAIFFRGHPASFSEAPRTYQDLFLSVYGPNHAVNIAGSAITELARKNVVHGQAVITAAQLAGAGMWTSSNSFGPLLHLAGIICVMPCLVIVLSQAWYGVAGSHWKLGSVYMLMPWNIIPMFFCQGIFCLRFLAFVVVVGCALQTQEMKRVEQKRRMKI